MKKFFFLFFTAFLFSCASSRFESDFAPVYVTNSAKFALMPTDAICGKVDSIEMMSAKFQDRQFDFDVYVLADDEQVSMVLMSEFGTTVASLFYDGERLDFDSAVLPKNIQAEYVVADFQFAFYDVERVRAELAKIGVDFEVSRECSIDGNCTETRKLLKKGKEIAKIVKNYSNLNGEEKFESMQYENFLRKYSYSVTVL